MLVRLGVEGVEVRLPEQLDGLDGLIIPGGESTTMMRLMGLYGLDEAIRAFPAPIFGTCAGMIVLDRERLGLIDLSVERNAFGRQVASFEAPIEIEGEDRALHRGLHSCSVDHRGGAGRRYPRRGRRAPGARARGPNPRRVVPSGADRRHAGARTVPTARPGGAGCQGIASGRRSSTRRAPPTPSAASSSRSSHDRFSWQPRRAAPTRPPTWRSRTRSRRRARTRCRRTTSTARSRRDPARAPTGRCSRPSSTRATAPRASRCSSRR